MGGFSSGNHGGKRCTSDLRELDVRRFARDGLLKPGYGFCWSWTSNGEKVASIGIRGVTLDTMRLQYNHQPIGGEKENKDYTVRLARTVCNLGGDRVWWHCPAAGCGRRVAVLYLGSTGVFACRHCNRLAYRSQRETQGDRLIRKAGKLRARLGWVPGILNGEGGKPKGMHWRTYWQLAFEHHTIALQVMQGLSAKFAPMIARLDEINRIADSYE